MQKISKKTKQKPVILFKHSMLCGCLPGFESAFAPVLKNRNSKTFNCPYCGKVYFTSNLNGGL